MTTSSTQTRLQIMKPFLERIKCNALDIVRSSTSSASSPTARAAHTFPPLPQPDTKIITARLQQLGASMELISHSTLVFADFAARWALILDDRMIQASMCIRQDNRKTLEEIRESIYHEQLSCYADLLISRLQSHNRDAKEASFHHEYVPFFQKYFEYNAYPSLADRHVLAKKSMMTARQVEVWFQNRRARAKKEGKELQRMHHTDPVPLQLSLKTLEESMPLFMISGSEPMQSERADMDEDIDEEDESPEIIDLTVDNELVLETGAQRWQIPPYAEREFVRVPLPVSWRRQPNNVSRLPPGNTTAKDFDELMYRLMQLRTRDGSRSIKPDQAAATKAFTYRVPPAPHPSAVLRPVTNYVERITPIDLASARKRRLPSMLPPPPEPAIQAAPFHMMSWFGDEMPMDLLPDLQLPDLQATMNEFLAPFMADSFNFDAMLPTATVVPPQSIPPVAIAASKRKTAGLPRRSRAQQASSSSSRSSSFGSASSRRSASTSTASSSPGPSTPSTSSAELAAADFISIAGTSPDSSFAYDFPQLDTNIFNLPQSTDTGAFSKFTQPISLSNPTTSINPHQTTLNPHSSYTLPTSKDPLSTSTITTDIFPDFRGISTDNLNMPNLDDSLFQMDQFTQDTDYSSLFDPSSLTSFDTTMSNGGSNVDNGLNFDFSFGFNDMEESSSYNDVFGLAPVS